LREEFPPETWDRCELRVESNTRKILDLLDKYNIKATFFVLGWIAERKPGLVKEIHSRGHEIASHGYGHIINYELSREEIYEDIKKSKGLLESITGNKVVGYRAPNFSVTQDVIDALTALGFDYDSSYHPFSKNQRYGQLGTNEKGIFKLNENLTEIPMSVWKKNFFELSIAGGGYFRLYPYHFFRALTSSYLKKNDYMIMYFHPWEFDPEQPRVKDVKFSYRFRQYVGLNNNLWKLEKLIREARNKSFRFSKLGDLIVR